MEVTILSKKDSYDIRSSPQTIRLLDRLIDGRVIKITPEYDLSTEDGFRYPAIDAILETKSQKTIKILSNLYEQGILKREFHDKIFQCPKCGKELRQIGVDYLRLGILHKCRDCNEAFHEPLDQLRCMKCMSIFSKEEVREKDLYAYTLNEAMREKVLIEIRPKRQIEEFLKKWGYRVQNSTVEGRSGTKHEFDIFAVWKSGILEHRIAIGISIAENQVEPEEILRLFAKAQDVDAHKIVMIAVPKISPNAKFFADHYKITCIEAQELNQAIKELEEETLAKPALTGETK